MANKEHVRILRQGLRAWNNWRDQHRETVPDLSGANLTKLNLRRAYLARANLSGANLTTADLSGASLYRANLSRAILPTANLSWADLWAANLERARLESANLYQANLSKANLRKANLRGASLMEAILVGANLEDTILTGSRIYGLSAWNVKVNEGTKQSGLIITSDEPTVTVDDLEVGQFIYLLLNRQKLRNVIATVTSKTVLILGRFTPERKAVLDAMAIELRKNNLVPIIFDFERATSRDFTETIKTLAGMSLFVIADITKPKSVPLECVFQRKRTPVPIQSGHRFQLISDSCRSEATLWG